jgi:iron complex outermembrane receptor protein
MSKITFVRSAEKSRHVAAIVLVSGLTVSVPVKAQTAGAPASDDVIPEVTVTARHRSENIQDVPASVQAIGGEVLTEKGTITLSDIQYQLPGFFNSPSNPRNTSLGIRGIGITGAAGDGVDNMVGVYFDGVYQGRPGMALQDLIDIDNFELLRGPQGTLFGRNTEAGALNITTNKPSFTTGATLETSFGNDLFLQQKAILTGPITDKVAFRTALFNTSQDGWVSNITDHHAENGTGRYGIRQQFLINASDDLTIRVAGDLERELDSSANTLVWTQAFTPATAPAGKAAAIQKSLAALQAAGWTPKVNTQDDVSNSLQSMRTLQGGTSVTADYNLDWATLTSISAWRFWQFAPMQDSDGTPLDLYEVNTAISRDQQLTQELRLTSPTGGVVDWQTGLFLFYQDLKDHYIIHQYGSNVIALYNAYNNTSLSPSILPAGTQFIENDHVQTGSEAFYNQATWHISHDLSLTGGARFTHDSKQGGSLVDTSQISPQVLANASLSSALGIAGNYPQKSSGYPLSAAVSTNNVSGSASLSYKVTPDTMTYTTFSNGYQGAALNINGVVSATQPVVVKPSTIDNYEVGVKTTLFDRRLMLNLDAYQEVLYNYQISVTPPVAGAKSYIANAGNVRSRGIEADATAVLGGGFGVTVDGAYNDAIFQSLHDGACPYEGTGCQTVNGVTFKDQTGNPAPNAPKVTFTVTPSYHRSIGDHEGFYAYAQYYRSSSFYSGTDDSQYSRIPAFFTLNLRAGVLLADGRYDISIYANNATNEHHYLSQTVNAALPVVGTVGVTAQPAPPAMYGVTLRAQF